MPDKYLSYALFDLILFLGCCCILTVLPSAPWKLQCLSCTRSLLHNSQHKLWWTVPTKRQQVCSLRSTTAAPWATQRMRFSSWQHILSLWWEMAICCTLSSYACWMSMYIICPTRHTHLCFYEKCTHMPCCFSITFQCWQADSVLFFLTWLSRCFKLPWWMLRRCAL